MATTRLYLIVRVQRAEATDVPNAPLPICLLSKRSRAEGVTVTTVEKLLNEAGYDLGPVIGRATRADWPLTAVAYCSSNKDGEGRVGSSLYRWPCRPSKR